MNNNIFFSYLKGLLNHCKNSSSTALSELLGNVSHDQLTALLHSNWNPQILLYQVISFFIVLKDGYLIIDDTLLPKSASKYSKFVKKQYSGKYKSRIQGLSIVVVIWTDGVWRIPLGLRIWSKGGKTKPDLALEIISEIRNKMKLKPEFVLFDSAYAKGYLLKRLADYGWYFVCGLACNRHFKGNEIRNYKNKMNWYSKGKIWNGMKVLAVRHKGKFFISNRLSLTKKSLLEVYSKRVKIEEFFKIFKQECGVGCQVRSIQAYTKHLYLCMINFLQLEHLRMGYIRRNNHQTIYSIRKSILSSSYNRSTPLLKIISARLVS
jgi:hypothetical protein